jgi:hypothetical protein
LLGRGVYASPPPTRAEGQPAVPLSRHKQKAAKKAAGAAKTAG